uniref:Transmembrane protein family 132 fourth domain-containing protein n=1 Tax=Schistocephalus solidus TaxID=70667 RepID=A0A0X3Q2J2_SCHSO
MIVCHSPWLLLLLEIFLKTSKAEDVLNAYFGSTGSAFLTDVRSTQESSIYSQDFITIGNTDGISLRVNVGNLVVNTSMDADLNVYENRPLTTVHLFQKELREDDPVLHFLCHSVHQPRSFIYTLTNHFSTCCVIKVTASNRHFFTGCLIDNWSSANESTCHASIQVESRIWNDSQRSELEISYRINTVHLLRPYSMNAPMESAVVSRQCLTPLATQLSDFKYLTNIILKSLQPDENREIGRNVLLEIPARRLKNGEYFHVPVRVKQLADIAEFTLRCEAPANTYIEFLRVVWPWESDESSLGPDAREADFRQFQLNSAFGAWDISQRHLPNLKGSVIEVVARYREGTNGVNMHENYREDPVIYKLLFRIVPPPKGPSGRVGPRLLWSLVSLSRRNTVDQAVSGSPIVTRLNVESLEYKYLALVLKSMSLVNTAVLSGYPTRYPVWVFGLTHSNELEDVTSRATCHAGDDTVIHFPRDSCSAGLLFSGGELSGSSALALVTKLDRSSAEENIVVWFPRPYTVNLVVDTPKAHNPSPLHEYATETTLLKALIDSHPQASDHGLQPPPSGLTHFQQARLRAFARFTLSTADFSLENTLGGHTLDVTDYTAHRLRLEYANEGVGKPATGLHSNHPEVPARLVLFSESYASQWPSLTPVTNDVKGATLTLNREEHSGLTGAAPSRVWLVGRRPGCVRVKLAPVADSPLVKAALPQSLIKLRKQHIRHHPDNQILWEPQQNLWVTVTDNDFVWPVGITAQLVTDLTITITKKETAGRNADHFQPNYPKTLHETNAGRPPITASFGHYTAHVRFSGSRVGRSSKGSPAVPADTTTSGPRVGLKSLGTNESFDLDYTPSGDDGRLKRIRRQTPARTLPRQGLLVVIVQFSDGSMLPWHRIMEVTWQLGLPSPPYKLVIENMRPDLVRVDMPTMPNSKKAVEAPLSGLGLTKTLNRRRRLAVEKGLRSNSNISYSSSSLRYSREADSQWFDPLQDQVPQTNLHFAANAFADRKLSQQPKENSDQPQWLGPTVVLLREDESFIGDLLKVNLLSNAAERVLFSAPVHASIVAARPSRRDSASSDLSTVQNGGTDRDSNPWTGTANTRPTVHPVTPTPNTISPPERFDRPPPFWSDPPKIVAEVEPQSRNIDSSGSLDPKDFSQWRPRKLSLESSWRFSESPDRGPHLDSLKQLPSESKGLPQEYDAKLLELFGSPALKDAPGMRPSGYRKADEYLAAKPSSEKTKSSPRDSSKLSSLDETSKRFGPAASGPANESDSPNERLQHAENGRILVASEDSNALLPKSGVSTNRPALELTMYILLGLFVLIALIFAVNCGAMVARYRWEHARIAKEAYRLQHLSELAMNSHNDDSAMECLSPAVAQDSQSSHSEFFTESAVINPPIDWKAAFLSAWRNFRRPFNRKADSNQHMSADNDWVWLGRDALERRTQTIPSSRAVTKLGLQYSEHQKEGEGRSILTGSHCEDSCTENHPLTDPPAPRSSALLTEAVVLSMQTSTVFSSAGAENPFCRPNSVQRMSAPVRPQVCSNGSSASAPPRKHKRSSTKCTSCHFQDEGYARLLSGPTNRCQDKSPMALPESTSEDPKQNTQHFYDSSAPATTSWSSHPQKCPDGENFFYPFSGC